MSRYQELYKSKDKMYSEGSPIIVEAMAIQKDTVENRVLAQIKFTNIDEKCIIACKIDVESYEVNGSFINTAEHSYLDLEVEEGDSFGTKEPIYLPDMARKIRPKIREVVYSGGEIFNVFPDAEIVPQQKSIYSFFDSIEFEQEYRVQTTQNAKYVPLLWKDLFICTCGRINRINNECYFCGCNYKELTNYLDPLILKQIIDEKEKEREEQEEARIRRELTEKVEAERKAAELAEELRQKKEKFKSKAKKLITICLILSVIIGVVAYIIFEWIIPYAKYNKEYNSAVCLMSDGEYDQAHNAFLKISGYRDADKQAIEAIYQKGMDLYNDEKYILAIDVWSNVKEYSNASEMIQKANANLYEDTYQEAIGFAKKNEYKKAIATIESCLDYKDSNELLKEYNFCLGKELHDRGEYSDSIKYLKKVVNHPGAKELIDDDYYMSGCALLESKIYTTAILQFNNNENYKDSKEKLLECKYQYVLINKKISLSNTTYDYLKELMEENYKDSAAIFAELTKLKAEVFAINNSETSIVNLGSMSKNDKIYFHFRITNGEPNKRYSLKIKTKLSGCSPTTSSVNARIGEDWSSSTWYAAGAIAGTATITIYDTYDNELCHGSVKLK